MRICTECTIHPATVAGYCRGCANRIVDTDRRSRTDDMQTLFGMALSLGYSDAADWLQVNYPWPSGDERAARLVELRRALFEVAAQR